MIPLKINNKNLWEIMDPSDTNNFRSLTTEEEKIALAIKLQMFPTEVRVSAETYSRDADRTANYELEELVLVNAKAKPEFTWSYLKYEYAKNLLEECAFKYDYKNTEGEIVPITAPAIIVYFNDLIGARTIDAYLGQSIDGVLEEYNGQLYWRDFRIAFPER